MGAQKTHDSESKNDAAKQKVPLADRWLELLELRMRVRQAEISRESHRAYLDTSVALH
jgi:hypothetical protein